MVNAGDYVEPLGGPGDANVRPPKRPRTMALVVAAIAVALVIAFLVANRVEDVPVDEPESGSAALADAPVA